MFDLFKDVLKRVAVEKEIRDFFSTHTDIDLNKANRWGLAKATENYIEEIKKYPNARDEEELIIYLIILHESNAFDANENEQVLGIVIKYVKSDESQAKVDSSNAILRQELRDRAMSWAQKKVLS